MEALKKLGLTKYEAAIYCSLLKNKKLTAHEIAFHSKVPPTAVYPNLGSLNEKKLIQKVNGIPAVYEVLNPKAAIENFIVRKKSDLEELQEAALKETEELFAQKPLTKEKEIVKLTRGRLFSAQIYDEAVQKVKKTLFILGWRFEKVGDRYQYLKKFRALLQKGVDVRIIVTGNYQKNLELIKAYQEERIKLKFLPLDNFSIVVVDGKECKITLKDRTLPEKHNIQILDPSLSQALHDYFLTLWNKAQEV